MIYMESDSYDPYFNLAFEEYVLTHYMDGDYLLLWQNDNTIVVGLNQNTEAEINRDFVEEHKIKVVRRMCDIHLERIYLQPYDTVCLLLYQRFHGAVRADDMPFDSDGEVVCTFS